MGMGFAPTSSGESPLACPACNFKACKAPVKSSPPTHQHYFYPRDVYVSAVFATATWLGAWLAGIVSKRLNLF